MVNSEQKKKTPGNGKWQDEFLVLAYERARDGQTEQQIAKGLGISKETFILWEETRPLFKFAVDRGRAYNKLSGVSLEDYRDDVYRTLSPEEQETWRQLYEANMMRPNPKRVAKLFAGKGKLMRQKLWLCAFMKCQFNATAACRMTGINRMTVEAWKKLDPQFWKLVQSLELAEKDWSQSCVRRLADALEPSVVIYQNRCLNRDRGMDDRANMRMTVEHTGTVEHTHRLVSFEDLDLDERTESNILRALRKLRKGTKDGEAAE